MILAKMIGKCTRPSAKQVSDEQCKTEDAVADRLHALGVRVQVRSCASASKSQHECGYMRTA